MKAIIDFLMERPIFYKLVQNTLAYSGHNVIKEFLVRKIPQDAKKILDQGCGVGEYALLFGKRYTGIDSNPKDIAFAKMRYPGNFIAGTATKMPFKRRSFDVVFAVGLHHHLNDTGARKAVKEALRVTKKSGKVIIIDAMLPKIPLNILGLMIRKMDRGRYVRHFEKTLNLLPKDLSYKLQLLSSFPLDYVALVISKNS